MRGHDHNPSVAGQSSFTTNTCPGFRVSVTACGLGLRVIAGFMDMVRFIHLLLAKCMVALYVLGVNDPIGHWGTTVLVTRESVRICISFALILSICEVHIT